MWMMTIDDDDDDDSPVVIKTLIPPPKVTPTPKIVCLWKSSSVFYMHFLVQLIIARRRLFSL